MLQLYIKKSNVLQFENTTYCMLICMFVYDSSKNDACCWFVSCKSTAIFSLKERDISKVCAPEAIIRKSWHHEKLKSRMFFFKSTLNTLCAIFWLECIWNGIQSRFEFKGDVVHDILLEDDFFLKIWLQRLIVSSALLNINKWLLPKGWIQHQYRETAAGIWGRLHAN